ncbi:M24 family metallopeptidase [Microlunatus sp. GCM10028923]|uniref:M24 family metallopeptidase n=1 Tax=Microlunatus sp. GCM10028923 TaxID=3273400 RepID=UPI0036134CD5
MGERTGDDHGIKRDRLLKIIADQGAGRLLLTSQPALAWYLDGARVHVNLAAPPIVAVLVGAAGDEVILTGNESARLRDEELPAGVEIRELAWSEVPAGIDLEPDTLHEDQVADQLRAARAPLLPGEAARYGELGRDAARVMTEVLSGRTPADTERAVAAALTGALVEVGAEPLVVLVGGADRLPYRHPLPTLDPVGRRFMAVLGARRHGLVINLTRWVRFGPAEPGEQSADERILAVEAGFLAATVPGSTLGDAFRAGCAGYAEHGFAADEWQRHHQGGVAGYNGRDPRATVDAADRILAGQAFAWNPTAPGCKVEDTVLRTETGFEVLTADPAWPTTPVADLPRPTTLPL